MGRKRCADKRMEQIYKVIKERLMKTEDGGVRLVLIAQESPEYLTFEKKLYEKTLRELGFGKLLPEERAPQKDMNKRKEKVEER